jgi:hypothetical protein
LKKLITSKGCKITKIPAYRQDFALLSFRKILQTQEDKMLKTAKRALVLVMIVSLLIIPFGSAALAQEYFETEDPSGGAMLFDLVAVRPIGLVATALGAVTFVLSWPFSALGDNSDVAAEKLVKDPAAYTFKRPLGEFNQGRNR